MYAAKMLNQSNAKISESSDVRAVKCSDGQKMIKLDIVIIDWKMQKQESSIYWSMIMNDHGVSMVVRGGAMVYGLVRGVRWKVKHIGCYVSKHLAQVLR